jgi:hypothetical protein
MYSKTIRQRNFQRRKLAGQIKIVRRDCVTDFEKNQLKSLLDIVKNYPKIKEV